MRSDLDSCSPQLRVMDRGRTESNWAVPRSSGSMGLPSCVQWFWLNALAAHGCCCRSRLFAAPGQAQLCRGHTGWAAVARHRDAMVFGARPCAPGPRRPREPATATLCAGVPPATLCLPVRGSQVFHRPHGAGNQLVTRRSQLADGAGVRERLTTTKDSRCCSWWRCCSIHCCRFCTRKCRWPY